MKIHAWQVLVELDRPAAGPDIGSTGVLAEAVRELSLPDTIIEQMGRAVSTALQRLAERGDAQLVRLTLSVKVAPAKRSGARRSWGFFLIEKPPDREQPHRIEVFLYQDAGSGLPHQASTQYQ